MKAADVGFKENIYDFSAALATWTDTESLGCEEDGRGWFRLGYQVVLRRNRESPSGPMIYITRQGLPALDIPAGYGSQEPEARMAHAYGPAGAVGVAPVTSVGCTTRTKFSFGPL